MRRKSLKRIFFLKLKKCRILFFLNCSFTLDLVLSNTNSSFVQIRPLIQTSHLILSVYLILSRVFDYYHHPSDLVFGSIVGTAGAILTYYFLFEYTESYWLKGSHFLYSYEDESEFVDSEQVDVDSEAAQKIRKKPFVGKDVVDKTKLRKTSNLVQAIDEKTALLSSSKSH